MQYLKIRKKRQLSPSNTNLLTTPLKANKWLMCWQKKHAFILHPMGSTRSSLLPSKRPALKNTHFNNRRRSGTSLMPRTPSKSTPLAGPLTVWPSSMPSVNHPQEATTLCGLLPWRSKRTTLATKPTSPSTPDAPLLLPCIWQWTTPSPALMRPSFAPPTLQNHNTAPAAPCGMTPLILPFFSLASHSHVATWA